jgi:hypothetical protein
MGLPREKRSEDMQDAGDFESVAERLVSETRGQSPGLGGDDTYDASAARLEAVDSCIDVVSRTRRQVFQKNAAPDAWCLSEEGTLSDHSHAQDGRNTQYSADGSAEEDHISARSTAASTPPVMKPAKPDDNHHVCRDLCRGSEDRDVCQHSCESDLCQHSADSIAGDDRIILFSHAHTQQAGHRPETAGQEASQLRAQLYESERLLADEREKTRGLSEDMEGLEIQVGDLREDVLFLNASVAKAEGLITNLQTQLEVLCMFVVKKRLLSS